MARSYEDKHVRNYKSKFACGDETKGSCENTFIRQEVSAENNRMSTIALLDGVAMFSCIYFVELAIRFPEISP